MNWLHVYFAWIDKKTGVVKLQIRNEPILKEEGGNLIRRGKIICLKSCKIIYKGCFYHIGRVKDHGSEDPTQESVPVMKDSPEELLDYLPQRIESSTQGYAR